MVAWVRLWRNRSRQQPRFVSVTIDLSRARADVAQGNPQGLILTYNLSEPFSPDTNVTGILLKNAISKSNRWHGIWHQRRARILRWGHASERCRVLPVRRRGIQQHEAIC